MKTAGCKMFLSYFIFLFYQSFATYKQNNGNLYLNNIVLLFGSGIQSTVDCTISEKDRQKNGLCSMAWVQTRFPWRSLLVSSGHKGHTTSAVTRECAKRHMHPPKMFFENGIAHDNSFIILFRSSKVKYFFSSSLIFFIIRRNNSGKERVF